MQAQAPKPKSRLRTFPEAVARLAELQAFATARGIALPIPAHPINTHTKANDLIADYERLLAGTSTVPVIPANAQPAAVLKDSETLFKRAHAIIAKHKQNTMPSSIRPAAPTISQAAEDMSRSELIAAIDREPDRQRIGTLFAELRRREKGEPSRRSIELTHDVSDQQLEQMIAGETDLDRRQELFTILRWREEWRRKS